MNIDLIERTTPLTALHEKFKDMTAGEGHCIMISGEAGMGKTALARAFCQEHRHHAKIYQGTCDALFTPRPLAPFYDIVWQIWGDEWNKAGADDRVALFAEFFHRFDQQAGPSLIVFEDIHWADEATLDFIKYLARRIAHLRCLFILTWRDEEIHGHHPLRQLLGQLPPHAFTRLALTPLSRVAVEQLAAEKGWRGEDVYDISGGNPFYVREILASYSPGIPDNVKDSILSVYDRFDAKAKQVGELLSVLPTGLETHYLEKLEPDYAAALAPCIETKIILLKDNRLSFKHELYRRTIESSLSPFTRIALNKKVLDAFLAGFEARGEIERIIHHAKNANDHELVVRFAPVAAAQAAALGAHVEALKLFYSAIEYHNGKDKATLVGFYESYAYECHLTNRVQEAIIYQQKATNIWKEKGDPEKMGNNLWFLSRLWWFDGNRRQAECCAREAIDTLIDRPASRAKAMAFSNMAQLKMISDQTIECIYWGDRAIEMAKNLGADDILSHAYNNVGSVRMRLVASHQRGLDLLRLSLDIALRHSFHEHAARAYSNLASNSILLKDFAFAARILDEGIRYCEQRELDSWRNYMLSWQSKLLLDTGRWKEACAVAELLVGNEFQASIVKIGALIVIGTVKLRCGEPDAMQFLADAKSKAFESMELQRILPALTALLEAEWITGKALVEKAAIEYAIGLLSQGGTLRESSEFDFWLFKTRRQQVPLLDAGDTYRAGEQAIGSAARWEQLGCPYEQALLLSEGNEEEKRQALGVVQRLGATAVFEKLRFDMRQSGIRSIPRGSRKSTLDNPAMLTERELGVLALLREGLPNKEIGSRLYISAKTVDHHISAILFKLEVGSRSAAVREAVRRGIIPDLPK
ncbi:MAG TPA: AAA family ATPase [Puia sp.]|nr:AAA family ATPase [Puia sp.]